MFYQHENNNSKCLQNNTYFKDYFSCVEFRYLERIQLCSNETYMYAVYIKLFVSQGILYMVIIF